MEGGTVKLRTEHAGTVPVAYAEGVGNGKGAVSRVVIISGY